MSAEGSLIGGSNAMDTMCTFRLFPRRDDTDRHLSTNHEQWTFDHFELSAFLLAFSFAACFAASFSFSFASFSFFSFSFCLATSFGSSTTGSHRLMILIDPYVSVPQDGEQRVLTKTVGT